MRGSTRARRTGITPVNVVVLILIVLSAAWFVLPTLNSARSDRTHNTCRSNLSNLALAMIQYDGRRGHYPGYMNVLERTDKSVYVDPDSGNPAPVSWVVELLPDLDRVQLYYQWQEIPGSAVNAAPTASSSSAAEPYNVKIYLEILTCPSADHLKRAGTPLSYVVNSGMPDLVSTGPAVNSASPPQLGAPRDWAANGLFFDNYSDDPRIETSAAARGPMILMRSDLIRDPKDKTLLLTENLDAGSYVVDSRADLARNPERTELDWGCIWEAGPIRDENGKLIMSPGERASAPNANRRLANQGPNYKLCRPSSSHPGGFNVAFAGKNVQFVRDTISYAIYAKLMSSDDANMKLPGSETLIDERFRAYQMRDEDLNP
jgi:hypothetical protein